MLAATKFTELCNRGFKRRRCAVSLAASEKQTSDRSSIHSSCIGFRTFISSYYAHFLSALLSFMMRLGPIESFLQSSSLISMIMVMTRPGSRLSTHGLSLYR